MFQTLERPTTPFTPESLEFLVDVLDQFNKSGNLSPAQFVKLQQIYMEKKS